MITPATAGNNASGIIIADQGIIGPQGFDDNANTIGYLNKWNSPTASSWVNHLLTYCSDGSLSPFNFYNFSSPPHPELTPGINLLNNTQTNSCTAIACGTNYFSQNGSHTFPNGLSYCGAFSPPDPGTDGFTMDMYDIFERLASDSIDFDQYDDENKWMSKFNLYQQLDSTSMANSAILANFKDSLVGLNIGVLDSIGILLADGDTAAAQTMFAKLTSATNSAEQAYMDYYEIAMKVTVDSIVSYHLGSGDIADLRTLAKKCPTEYGSAVFLARALLQMFQTDSVYINDCEKGPVLGALPRLASNDEITKNQKPLIYPNPTNGNVNVILDSNITKCSFELINSQGQVIKAYSLTKGANKFEIDLTPYGNGIYYYRIINFDGKDAQTGKIVYIKD